MQVTRDVIYDLLPAYFADEVSADTRALIEHFFSTDPEFAKMADRFRTMHRARTDSHSPHDESRHEQAMFGAAMARARLRHGGTAGALAAVLALVISFMTPGVGLGFQHPGVIIAIVFAVTALLSWLTSFRRNPGRW
jgi:anti-sigma factor RsiW